MRAGPGSRNFKQGGEGLQVIFPDSERGSWQRERLLESLEAYRRGLAEAPVLRRWSVGPVDSLADSPVDTLVDAPVDSGETVVVNGLSVEMAGKEAGGESKGAPPMTFLISNEEVDRHGDVVLAQGWRLDAYRRNPVFLWAHDYTRPVIGRALSVWTEPGQLLARMDFAPTDFAREVAALYRSGYQQGVSVGFKPLRYEERRQDRTGAFLGIRFLEQELLEVSAVPVPANRNALRRGLEPPHVLSEVLAALKTATW